MGDILAEVITEAVGERCPDFEPDCIGCQAWVEYDRLKGLEAENASLREALRPFADVSCLARSDLMKPIMPKLDGFTPLTITITKGQLLEAVRVLNSSARQS